MVSVANVATYEALRTALHHEELTYIETLKRDVERARMQAEDIRSYAGDVAADLRGAQQEMIAIIDADPPPSRAVLSTALRRANNAMVDANRDLAPDEEDEDEMETTVGESEEEEEEEDDLHCVLCRSTNGNNRSFFNMEPEGRWAGLAPGARIVCSICYHPDMGRVESFF